MLLLQLNVPKVFPKFVNYWKSYFSVNLIEVNYRSTHVSSLLIFARGLKRNTLKRLPPIRKERRDNVETGLEK